MTKIDPEMHKALAAYSGPVTRCRPRKARAADMPKREDRQGASRRRVATRQKGPASEAAHGASRA
jgi:hypothetical protein